MQRSRWVSLSAIHHEAGHAVMYWFTGRAFRYVTIAPRKPGYEGYIYPYNLGRERQLKTEQACLDVMTCRAAGPIAQNYFNTHRPLADHHILLWLNQPSAHESSDHDLAVFTFVGKEMDRVFRSDVLPAQKGPRSWLGIWHEAQNRIEDLWPAVQAVAAALDEERTLPGNRTFEIAATAMRNVANADKGIV